MNTQQIAKQVKIAMIEAMDQQYLFSDVDTKLVRLGLHGTMSQRTFSERMEKRNAPGAY